MAGPELLFDSNTCLWMVLPIVITFFVGMIRHYVSILLQSDKKLTQKQVYDREALRWALFSMQATGHVMLGTSCYLQQLLDATEEGQPPKGKASSLIPTCLRILQ
ncbi:cell death activator CIDE-3-like isoform X1 [Papio anubis]|uniref:cell death activator CIDE-3-like isoform X1 n=2 Tax=Papio anubis TaxID=9555 RepID=UPI0012AD5193|nr:cell death activator CIDE-3-like isoform X1 [Papio anubis]